MGKKDAPFPTPAKPLISPLSVRVYYEDTDAGGIVYYANYLRFAERARTEWLRSVLGREGVLWTKEEPSFVVRRVEVDYNASAYLDDLLTVATSLTQIGGASLQLRQTVWREAQLLVSMQVVLVAVTADGKVSRIPKAWGQKLTRFLEKGVSS